MINEFKTHSYDANIYPFKELINKLYKVDKLEQLHVERSDLLPQEKLKFENEASTKFHKIFYDKLNNNWSEFKNIYEKFVKNEISKLIEEPFVYQYLPSYRVQIPNEKAIHKWHFDSDDDHKHPDGEINFCIAITKMKDTTAIWAESLPGKKDFFPMEIDYGEFFNFNGNKCTHGNKTNITKNARVSFDFRILPKSKYQFTNKKTSVTSKKKFVIGEYYKASENF
jgi:ectoine hydroxylase-related dioxygenase (phytanoyl-CoA dioxygenase family)